MSGEFTEKHIGYSEKVEKKYLKRIGATGIQTLIKETIPSGILKNDLPATFSVPGALSEPEYLKLMQEKAAQNKIYRDFTGGGYYPTFTPALIRRNILENPAWYSAYTPYQSEIAQGRLEALLNFQTMVSEITGLPLANASLLDEATAAAEAMAMLHRARKRSEKKAGRDIFFVDENIFSQSMAVIKTRAETLGIEIQTGNIFNIEPSAREKIYGALLQYPAADGSVDEALKQQLKSLKDDGIKIAMATDLLALQLLTPPGEMGADVAFGSSQRFGVPMYMGGPHAAFYAAGEEYLRQIPGRIMGVSKDRLGNDSYRMTLQTREQHIRRETATSNICTAQALLAVMAVFYAHFHRPGGLRKIAEKVNKYAGRFYRALENAQIKPESAHFFDTITVQAGESILKRLKDESEKRAINLGFTLNGRVQIAFNETVTDDDLTALAAIFSTAFSKEVKIPADNYSSISNVLFREKTALRHPVFSLYRSETALLRYMTKLSKRDLALDTAMIPLGSCTMKLNPASALDPVSWPEFAEIHPFAPEEQRKGYLSIMQEISDYLGTITGLPAVSLQPNSGAQGEYAGLLAIRAFHRAAGEKRHIALIPVSAHGTNPASAVMAGFKVKTVACDEDGNIQLDDLKKKCEEHSEELGALMVTYPSTHGVYEEAIKEICQTVHNHGGRVYMDGANLNAQLGMTSPAEIGADVCHLNLHKTFGIPHGGGGPGMGPICATEELRPHLPGYGRITEGASGQVSAAEFGSPGITLISYGFIRMLGSDGLRESGEKAILSANYLAAELDQHYDILYKGSKGRVAHEFIIDCRGFNKSAGIEVEDIAKRLIDYGFHAPTVSFPVAGTMMIEPTESEDEAELQRFVEAMISIREEIREIEEGRADRDDNVLKMSPHTAEEVSSDNWSHPYSRDKAAYPVASLRENKFWPVVARIDNVYGDRNPFCLCPSPSEFDEA